MSINIRNQSTNELPDYATNGAAGMDIRAYLPEAVTLQPLERRLIPTGLFLEIPLGFEVQIRPRSGLAYKHGITVLNSPGTIDSDYRGEVGVLLVNLSNEAFVIENGERIAQMVVAAHEQASWKEVSELSDTDRGAGGFGSTGKH
ncbi:MAG: dUTP diphosphatase [Bacteroidota bacterium]